MGHALVRHTLKWVYRASRRFIFYVGGGLGSKLALLLETLATENRLFFLTKNQFFWRGLSDKNITNNCIFQGHFNSVSESGMGKKGRVKSKPHSKIDYRTLKICILVKFIV